MNNPKNNPAGQERGNDSDRESFNFKTYAPIIALSHLNSTVDGENNLSITAGKWNGHLSPSNRMTPKLDGEGYPEIAYDQRGRAKLRKGLALVTGDKSISLHLVCDTEFTTAGGVRATHSVSRSHLSTQIKGFGADKGELFWHPNVSGKANAARLAAGLPPFPTLECVFAGMDYLALQGCFVSMERCTKQVELNALPDLDCVLYAHFAVAELNLLFQGELYEDVLQAQRDGYITQERRVIASNSNNPQIRKQGTWQSNWVITINGMKYRFCLGFMDTAGLQGVAGYKDIATNVGIALEYKDDIAQEQKEKMDEVMLASPAVFADYALGDLEIDKILVAYVSQMKLLYERLGLMTHYKEPKPTIGATVAQLLKAALQDNLKLNDEGFKAFIDEFLIPNSPSEIINNHRDSRVLLQKVQGGRCGTHDGRVVNLLEYLIDNDVVGCYAEGMRYQVCPFGRPEIMSFDDSKNNNPPTLLEWMRSYGVVFKNIKDKRYRIDKWGELLNGLWQARITVTDLPFQQTLFESWLSPSGDASITSLRRLLVMDYKSDCERDETKPFNLDYGQLATIKNEIHNAVLTHDLLQMALSVMMPEERDYFLNNARVIASEVHPASQRCGSYEEMVKQRAEWTGQNQIIRKVNRKNNRPFIIRKECECYAWYGVTLGELVIDNLLTQRKIAQATDCDGKTQEELKTRKRTPLETLFKLMANTTYGVISSPHFVVSRSLVGNNITARARTCVFAMEQPLKPLKGRPSGLGCLQVITDGGCMVNPFPKVTDHEELARLLWDLLVKSFPNCDIFSRETTAIKLVKNESGEYVREYVPRKGMFSFEIKCATPTFTGHGSANYLLWNEKDSKWVCKGRGYEAKQHQAWEVVDDGGLKQTNHYQELPPFATMMHSLRLNPQGVPRGHCAVKTGILKIKEYAKNPQRWDKLGLVPGDTIWKIVLVPELSLSQFRFLTIAQFKGWNKAYYRLKETHYQSFECFFLNEDGTLDYESMVNWVWDAIERGVIDPLKELDKSRNKHRKPLDHPAKKCRDLLALQFTTEAEEDKLKANRDNYHNWMTATGKPPEIDTPSRRKATIERAPSDESSVEPLTTRRKATIKRAPVVVESPPEPVLVVARRKATIKRAPQ